MQLNKLEGKTSWDSLRNDTNKKDIRVGEQNPTKWLAQVNKPVNSDHATKGKQVLKEQENSSLRPSPTASVNNSTTLFKPAHVGNSQCPNSVLASPTILPPIEIIFQLSKISSGQAEQSDLAYLSPINFLRAIVKPRELYWKLIKQEDEFTQYTLAKCYQYGVGVQQDSKKAAELYQQAAKQGYPAAQYNLARCCEYGMGVPRDYKKAVELYQKAADQGYPPAQLRLGQCYEIGRGVQQNYKKAVELYQKAADQGDPTAQYNLVRCYQDGVGVQQNETEAGILNQIAAAKEGALARFQREIYYKINQLVKQNYGKAVELYRKLIEQGYPIAQYELVEYYQDGVGVQQNETEAVKYWYQKIKLNIILGPINRIKKKPTKPQNLRGNSDEPPLKQRRLDI